MDINKKKIQLTQQILQNTNINLLEDIASLLKGEKAIEIGKQKINVLEEYITIKSKNHDFIIDSNCFTLTKLADYLNNNYNKKSGAKFTPHEAKEFVKHGRLPTKYGGNVLEYLSIGDTGIKFVRLIK